jgi:hypothetical protein
MKELADVVGKAGIGDISRAGERTLSCGEIVQAVPARAA